MADNKQSQAFRSTTVLAMPPEDTEIIPLEQKEIDDEQDHKNATYASLQGHPGWELIKKDFQQSIDDFRSGKALEAACLDPGISDSDLGKLTRTSIFVASELQKKLLTVESAALALEEKRQSGQRTKPKSF